MLNDTFAIFCKTYNKDIANFERMLNSFNKHNVENLHLYVSVPTSDVNLFNKFQSNTITLVKDESYAGKYFTEEQYYGLSLGYINQEICKLSFWETGISKNYLCVDSDVYFIRDFTKSDFMFDNVTPYTILVMDKDLSIEKDYQEYWDWRQSKIIEIYDFINFNDRRYRTCHGMQVLNSLVLESLKKDLLKRKELNYKDLIKISPFEFTWYNVWFQKCKLIDEYAVEPFFKTLHSKTDYNFARYRCWGEKDIARAYVGIVLNSNWCRYPKYVEPGILQKIFYHFIEERTV